MVKKNSKILTKILGSKPNNVRKLFWMDVRNFDNVRAFFVRCTLYLVYLD